MNNPPTNPEAPTKLNRKDTTMHPHLEIRGTTTQLIVDGNPFIMLAGELHNSSAACLDDIVTCFNHLQRCNLNTIVAPVYWELIEPEAGRFDFTLLDDMLAAARARNLRLVLLWFGTWKNGKSSYVPRWVKLDPARFPRMRGRSGLDTSAITALSEAARDADATAFAAMMRHLRHADGAQHTVLMVQVENEPGMLDAPRDLHPLADAAFRRPVPAALTRYLESHRDTLLPETRAAWIDNGALTDGTWSDLFGSDADEVFMAWHIAAYIETIAARGSEHYPLPMYANAWLNSEGQKYPGQYPSGGPVARMMDIWRAAAPTLKFIAPDIYLKEFKAVCADFTRSGNPLFIPETVRDRRAAAAVFHALGRHSALGFSPFAIEDTGEDHPLFESYRMLRELMPAITHAQAEGRIWGTYQETSLESEPFPIAGYKGYASPVKSLEQAETPGGFLIIARDAGLFWVVGRGYNIEFSTADAEHCNIELLSVYEGTVRGDTFVPRRRLNGDETWSDRNVRLPDRITVLQVELNTKATPISHQKEWTFPEHEETE